MAELRFPHPPSLSHTPPQRLRSLHNVSCLCWQVGLFLNEGRRILSYSGGQRTSDMFIGHMRPSFLQCCREIIDHIFSFLTTDLTWADLGSLEPCFSTNRWTIFLPPYHNYERQRSPHLHGSPGYTYFQINNLLSENPLTANHVRILDIRVYNPRRINLQAFRTPSRESSHFFPSSHKWNASRLAGLQIGPSDTIHFQLESLSIPRRLGCDSDYTSYISWAKNHVQYLWSLSFQIPFHKCLLELFELCSTTLTNLELDFFSNGTSSLSLLFGVTQMNCFRFSNYIWPWNHYSSFNLSSLPHLQELTIHPHIKLLEIP